MNTKSTPQAFGAWFSLNEHLKLYRSGKGGPLTYSEFRVSVDPCRQCGELRPDDGTPCPSCGAYKHCVYRTLDVRPAPIVEEVPVTTATTRGLNRPSHTKSTKPVNPRRHKRNAA